MMPFERNLNSLHVTPSHWCRLSFALQNSSNYQAKGPEDCPPERAFATIDEEPDDAEDDGASDDEFHYFASFLVAAACSRHRSTM
jgi:hypothetical protein